MSVLVTVSSYEDPRTHFGAAPLGVGTIEAFESYGFNERGVRSDSIY